MNKVVIRIDWHTHSGYDTPGEELEAILEAGNQGFRRVLEDAQSNEITYLAPRTDDPLDLDYENQDTLRDSLKEAGYTIVELYDWYQP